MDALRSVLTRLETEGAALGHFNVSDLVLLKATDDDDFRKAIAAGINIIHVSTELRVAWRRSLEGSLAAQPNEVAPFKILRPVVDSVAEVVGSRLRLFNEKRMPKVLLR